jgi:hypothetical protein
MQCEDQTVSDNEEGEHEQEREYDINSIYYEDRNEINNDHSQMMYDQTASVVPDAFSQQLSDQEQDEYLDEEE